MSTHSSNFVSLEGNVRNLLSWQTSAKAQLNQLSGIKSDISSLKSWKINHDSWAGTQASRISKLEGWRTAQTSTSGKHGTRIGALEDWKNNHDKWAGDLYWSVDGLKKKTDTLKTWQDNHDKWAGDLYRRVDKHQTWIDNHDEYASSLYWSVDGLKKKTDNLKTWQDNHDVWAGEQVVRLTTLENRVSDLSSGFSDVAIIASINLQGKNNTDLWNAEQYDGGSINEKDGKAVKLFKIQFQGLKTHISSMLKTYFGEDGIYTKLMQKPLNRIMDLLELIKDKEIKVDIPDLTDNFTRLMMLLGTLLGLIKDNHQVIQDLGLKELSTRIIELLEAIRDKELTVEIPPFEISEIKNMPDINLSEKGNGWLKTLIKTIGDVIETAIKTMGDVMGKAIDGVSENLGKLIDLVGGLLDDVIKLIVPENLDFMNKRFDGFQKKIKVKFNFLFSGIDGFKGLFSNQKKIEDIDFSLGAFGNNESVSIPLSWMNKFAPYVRPIITGFIALEFLIDMYKWFHTRGEVVE